MSESLPIVNTSTDYVDAIWIKLNNVINLINTAAVTVSTNGDLTFGNGFIVGNFGANTLSTTTLKGGNTSVSSNLLVSTNLVINTSLYTGNSTQNSVVNSTGFYVNGNPYSYFSNGSNITANAITTNNLYTGNVYIASNNIQVGPYPANQVFIEQGMLYVQNSSVGVTINTTSIIVATYGASYSASVNQYGFYVGNSTQNTSQNSSGFYINGNPYSISNGSNITANIIIANIADIGNSTSNVVINSAGVYINGNGIGGSGFANGSNIIVNNFIASNVSLGNTTQNVSMNSSFLSIGNNYTSFIVNSSTLQLGNYYEPYATEAFMNTSYLFVGNSSTSFNTNASTLQIGNSTGFIANASTLQLGSYNSTLAFINTSFIFIGNSSIAYSMNSSTIFSGNSFMNTTCFYVGNSTQNTSQNSSGFYVGNSSMNSTIIEIGSFNVTEAFINSTFLLVGNSSISFNANSSTIQLGNSSQGITVNTNGFYVEGTPYSYFSNGSNISTNILTTNNYISGNSSTNLLINSTSLEIQNSSTYTTINTFGFFIENGTQITQAGITTGNTVINSTSFYQSNSTGNTSIFPGSVQIGNSTQNTIVNSTGFYVNGNIIGLSGSGSTIAASQSVQFGPSSSGLPTFLPSTSSNLSITAQNISSSVPLCVSSVSGFNSSGFITNTYIFTSNMTWSGLTASNTNYLFLNTSNGATFVSTLQPIYQFGNGSISSATNQFTFDYQNKVGYLGNGSSLVVTPLVCVGQVTTNSTSVNSSIAYAYNGYYDSGFTNTLPSSTTNKNHNLGVCPLIKRMIIQCTSADESFSVGMQLCDTDLCFGNNYIVCSAAYYPTVYPLTLYTSTTSITLYYNSIYGQYNYSGNILTNSKYEWKFVASRGW